MSEKKQREISLQNLEKPLETSLLSDHNLDETQSQCKIIFENNTSIYESELDHVPNLIRNQKYSIITFIPLVLYEQFKYFFNLFYLLTALSQFIPALKVGLLFSFVAPLLLVLALTMMKEAYEDYQRFLKDKEINEAEFITINGSMKQQKKSSELKEGDIIEVSSGENVPADCLVLASLSQKPSIFIKTDQLDGQTDWKLRKAILEGNELQPFTVLYEKPEINIYQFIGSIKNKKDELVGLSLENTAWRGVRVAVGKCLMLVIYTGKHTKLSLNMKQASTKFGKMDEQLNFLSKILFVIMILLSALLILMRGSLVPVSYTFVLFFKYFLLLCSIIPISMRVNLDFAKLVYKFYIDRDDHMTDPMCRNSNIPEQLGRIEYILSDKTGTLTQNEMLFKKLYINQDCKYEVDDLKPLMDIAQSDQFEVCGDLQPNTRPQRNHKQITYDTIVALMMCHNVTPVVEDGTETLQGSSPDQLTLVRFGESLGWKLLERTEDLIKLSMPEGDILEYRILDLFPFTSESKRMGIVVQNKSDDKIVLYLKGADTIMQDKISALSSDFMLEACADLARQGLRTLVITEKVLSAQYYKQWKKQYEQANAALKDREDKIKQCRKRLEGGMMFLAITGVEDKLQDKVVQTVGSARSIGIKVWMLTGDKVETAICVGRGVKLIQGREELLYVIEGVKTIPDFHTKLHQFYALNNIKSPEELEMTDRINCVLVIDGTSLKIALMEIEEEFFRIAVKLPAIICSRVSPTQKAQIACLVRKYNKSEGRVLGIGDGGNDVALIQSAHVGVGIYGKQGVQAALASDFSIGQFKDLNQLMYWHGRLAYKRSALLSQFIIHRGVIITFMQAIFIIEFHFVPMPIYNGFLILGYSTIFTMLPVFSLILDEDISRKVAQRYPILYNSTRQGNEVSLYSFLYWMFISLYQALVIMALIALTLMYSSFYMVTTVSFTCLVLIQFLNVFTELNKIHIVQIICTFISFLMYAGTIFLMKNILNATELFTTNCFPITLLIVAIAWGPPFIYEVFKRVFYPTEEQKIMKQAKSIVQ